MKHGAAFGIMALAALGLVPAGCRNTAEGVKRDAQANSAAAEKEAKDAKASTADERAAARQAGEKTKGELENAGEAVGDAARAAGETIKDAAQTVGEKVKEGAKDVTPALEASKQTLDVKAALMADQTVDSSHIDVDTDQKTHTVHLKGTVPTAAQKAEAEKIARKKASGYHVHNMLTVARAS